MKKIVKSMATLLMVAGVVGFMGCKQPTTPEVVVAPKKVGTQKINKVDYDIVEFGIWPQTKYSGDEKNLKPCEKGINAWEQRVCFTDRTDNYIKVIAVPNKDSITEFKNGETYYFKLEPIQWRVLTNDYKIPDGKNEDGTNKYKSSGKKLLFAEKALAAHKYHNTSNKYDTSDIRTYLNNDFIKKAFTTEEIAKIAETNVDNSWQSIFGTGETGSKNQYACDNTNDKIFLLSEKEITTSEYGFDAYNKGGTDSTRIRKTTDYARATGAWVGSGDYVNNSVFWLRSPFYLYSNGARSISNGGMTNGFNFVYDAKVGVVPALSISF